MRVSGSDMLVQFLPSWEVCPFWAGWALEFSGARIAWVVFHEVCLGGKLFSADSAVHVFPFTSTREVVREFLAGPKPRAAWFTFWMLHIHVHVHGCFGQVCFPAIFAREYAVSLLVYRQFFR